MGFVTVAVSAGHRCSSGFQQRRLHRHRPEPEREVLQGCIHWLKWLKDSSSSTRWRRTSQTSTAISLQTFTSPTTSTADSSARQLQAGTFCPGNCGPCLLQGLKGCIVFTSSSAGFIPNPFAAMLRGCRGDTHSCDFDCHVR